LRGKYDKADEETLIKACLRQRAAAQKALYERFSALMMGVCYRYARNRADAEDILQDGFVKVFTHLDQFRGQGSLEGWIRRIMVTTAINFLNKNKMLSQTMQLDDALSEISDGQAGQAPRRQDEWMEMLAGLPAGYRAIVNLYAIEGYSHKEIGTMLGIAESTSRSQYARAKAHLIQKKTKQVEQPDTSQLKDDR